jgi:hypothetical protein
MVQRPVDRRRGADPARARDWAQLHALVSRMLHAYARLHAHGVLHGDIHPGNCLVRDDGRIVILDFGHARSTSASASDTDVARAGIPQFHDPQMAEALLAGRLPPAATAASEQYAIAALSYLLLTGLGSIDAPAVRDDLLRRIVERPPLPFAARGVQAWPAVEQVLHRALARASDQRFADMGVMARAFASAKVPTMVRWAPTRHPRAATDQAFSAAISRVRRLAPMHGFDCDQAWFALRAALAMEDAELLAAADLLVDRADCSWSTSTVAAKIAQARSDIRAEGRAITAFLSKTDSGLERLPSAQMLLAASYILQGASHRCAETAALASWSARWGHRLATPSNVLAALALVKTGRVPMPDALAPRLASLARDGRGGVWLWALAHDVFADDRYRTLALSVALPRAPLMRTFALLRRHQLTGEQQYLDAARRIANAASSDLPEAAFALLVAELHTPETALLPPFREIFGVPLRP